MDDTITEEYSTEAYRKVISLMNLLSLISMACGILSLVCLMAVALFHGDAPTDFFMLETSIIAVITGMIVLMKVRKDPNLPGKGPAVAGLVSGGLMLLLILSFIIVVLVKGPPPGAIG